MDSTYKDGAKMKGMITVRAFHADGTVEERKIDNIVTDTGRAEVANLLAGTGTAFTYLAIGTGTNAASVAQTALQTELVDVGQGLTRAAAVVTRVTTSVANDTEQLVKEWTCNATVAVTIAVTEVGALNAASLGVTLGRQVFAAVNLVANDKLQITYKFQAS